MGRGRGGSDPRAVLLGGATRIRSEDDNFLNLISNGDPKDSNVFWDKLAAADAPTKERLLKSSDSEIYETQGFKTLLDLDIKKNFSKEYIADLDEETIETYARWVLTNLRSLLEEGKSSDLKNILFYKGGALGDTESRAEEIIRSGFGSSGDTWRTYGELNIARVKDNLGNDGDINYDDRIVYSLVPMTTKKFMAGTQPGVTGHKVFLKSLNKIFGFSDEELQKLEADFSRREDHITNAVYDAFRQGTEINEIVFRNYYSSEVSQNLNSTLYKAVFKNYDLGVNQAIEREVKEHGGESVLKRFLPIFDVDYPGADADREEFLELFEDPIFDDFDKEHFKDLIWAFSKAYVSSNLYGKDTCDIAEANKAFLKKFTDISFDEGMRQL